MYLDIRLRFGIIVTFKKDLANFHLGRAAAAVPKKRCSLAIVKTVTWKFENVGRDPLQRVELEPLNEEMELTVFFEHVKNVVVPSVFADKACIVAIWRSGTFRLFADIFFFIDPDSTPGRKNLRSQVFLKPSIGN